MLIFLLFASLLGLVYYRLIGFLLVHWEEIPVWNIPEDFSPSIRVSVLVPARNEADNILPCLEGLLRQEFPPDLLEIIVIDDHSTDGTPGLVSQLSAPHLRLLQLTGREQGKKAALAYGIREATGSLILTTDADCAHSAHWVAGFVSFCETHDPAFVTGPVVFQAGDSALEQFQALDVLGTMLITGAGIRSRTLHMSNGANLAYPKQVFESIDGFTGIDQLASGDDMLLMHKIREVNPQGIAFLKSPIAVVSTPAVAHWRAFVQQRLRWATKSGTYRDKKVIIVLGLVFLLCWSILLSPMLMIIYGWPGLLPGLILFSLKSFADYQLLGRAARYFGQPHLLRFFWTSQVLHILYIAIIGLLANVVKQYKWKGRRQR